MSKLFQQVKSRSLVIQEKGTYVKHLDAIFQLFSHVLDTFIDLVAPQEDLEKVALCQFPDQVCSVLQSTIKTERHTSVR